MLTSNAFPTNSFRASHSTPRARTKVRAMTKPTDAAARTAFQLSASTVSRSGWRAVARGRTAMKASGQTLAAGCGDQNSFDGRTPSSLARRGEARRGLQGRGESAASAGVVAAVDGDGDAGVVVGAGQGAPPARDATRCRGRGRRRGESFGVALENSPKHETGNMNCSKLHSDDTRQTFCNTRRTQLSQNGAFPLYPKFSLALQGILVLDRRVICGFKFSLRRRFRTPCINGVCATCRISPTDWPRVP